MHEEEADNNTDDDDHEDGEDEGREDTDKEGGEEDEGNENAEEEGDEDEAVESEGETEDGIILSNDDVLNITAPCHQDESVSHVEIHAQQPQPRQVSTITMKSVSQFKLST